MTIQEKLQKFRDLQICKDQLGQEINKKAKSFHPIEFNNLHVINALEQYRNNKISKQELVDWVNVLWFWDEWYSFPKSQADCLASVMDELEELDEIEGELEDAKIQKYISALEQNLDISLNDI